MTRRTKTSPLTFELTLTATGRDGAMSTAWTETEEGIVSRAHFGTIDRMCSYKFEEIVVDDRYRPLTQNIPPTGMKPAPEEEMVSVPVLGPE